MFIDFLTGFMKLCQVDLLPFLQGDNRLFIAGLFPLVILVAAGAAGLPCNVHRSRVYVIDSLHRFADLVLGRAWIHHKDVLAHF